MASANPAAAAEGAGQRDELAESLAELFSNVSLMVRGELQVSLPPRHESNPLGSRSFSAASSVHST